MSLKMTSDARVADAEFALAFLEKQVNVDASKIGLIGHSAGGWTMIQLANKKQYPIKAIISMDGIEGALGDPNRAVINNPALTGTMHGIVYKIFISNRSNRSTVTTWPELKILSFFEEKNTDVVVLDEMGHEHFATGFAYSSGEKVWNDYLLFCQIALTTFKQTLNKTHKENSND